MALLGDIHRVLGPTATAESSHPKTDVVTLKNSDRTVGEIKRMGYGILSFNTDAAGTISLTWTHLKSLVSLYAYQLEMTSGYRYLSSLAEPHNGGESANQQKTSPTTTPSGLSKRS